MPIVSLLALLLASPLDQLADQYFDQVYFDYAPTAGTIAGFHQYDGQLEDLSASTIHAQIAALHQWEKKLEQLDDASADRDILLNSIRSTLLRLESIRGWKKNPDLYSSGPTAAIFALMERPYAPADARLKAAVEREKQIPKVLMEARQNLENPPRVYTEIALEQLPGIISFFEHDVPAAFAEATDAETRAAFAKTNAAVIDALQKYGAWLKVELLPRSKGDFRWGRQNFVKALARDEMVELPLEKLLQIGLDDLHRNQAHFARIAKEIDPAKTPQQELAELATIHPPPEQLLKAFSDSFDSLIAFIQTRRIVTIPSEVRPTLEETPPFMRATTFASMDSPGPYEKGSTKALFNVTLAEKDWTPAHVAEHMAAFNVGTIVSTSIHEAYPGHYTQFLWQPQFPSKIRKLLGANTNVEGWAHYCEQMMLDEGYGEPETREGKLIRLGQLQDALLRNARFIVGIRMHTGVGGPMSFDEAVNFFVNEGYQSRAGGTVETKRGTSDATYLYYTLGKLQIMKLREDLRQKSGAAFKLQQFHDDFLRQGPAPIKVIRRSMLHDDSPVL
jgi:uncharacterized protein (DUF885 family)